MRSRSSILMTAFVASFATGCMSMQGSSTWSAISDAIGKQPVVEAFIEYAGPHERWAGPQSFVLHVAIREGAKGPEARVEVSPNVLEAVNEPEMNTRAPSSLKVTSQTGHAVSAELARDYLEQFSNYVTENSQSEFVGCVSPVRVRLVRADGSLTERSGCRGSGRLASGASELVNFFLSSERKPQS